MQDESAAEAARVFIRLGSANEGEMAGLRSANEALEATNKELAAANKNKDREAADEGRDREARHAGQLEASRLEHAGQLDALRQRLENEIRSFFFFFITLEPRVE